MIFRTLTTRLCILGAVAAVVVSASTGQTISLDGTWQFAVDSAGAFRIGSLHTTAQWRTAKVPLSWQAQFPDLRDYQGVAWYRRTVEFPRLIPEQTIVLHFGAVDYMAKVFVNGVEVGTHEGGYLPFEFDIRRHARAGKNDIVVRVMDPVTAQGGTEGITYQTIPHGKQSWYVQTSGLWQSAYALVTPMRHVRRVKLTPSVSGSLEAEIFLTPSPHIQTDDSLILQVLDLSGNEVAETSVNIPGNKDLARLSLKVPEPALWSPSSPVLYTAVLSSGAEEVWRDRFGFRSIETRDGHILLNGKPFYMIGALDQDFYPDEIYTTPSEEYLRDEMISAKGLGLNTLRCHIKVPDPRYLAIADEVGLLVWYEIPNWDILTEDSKRRGESTLAGMLERDWNHPSLVVLSIINESWGIDLGKADQRAWLKEAFDRAKRLAPGRLVVDNSACWGNFHVKTDLNDYHTYWAIPENSARFDRTVEEVASRPAWLFSTHGDAEQTGKEPLLISEFGNWGLPKLPAEKPWWFSRPFGNAKVALPAGVDERFASFGYGRMFGSYNDLAEACQETQWSALKYEIEQMRLHPEIQGYIITEFTDVNWESNGLLDMWRHPKKLAFGSTMVQQEDVLIPRPERTNVSPGDTVAIHLWFSKYSDRSFEGATLEWETDKGQHGSLSLPATGRASVTRLPDVVFQALPADDPSEVSVTMRIVEKKGGDDVVNTTTVYVFPSPRSDGDKSVRIYDPSGTLPGFGRAVSAAGYSVSSDRGILVTRSLDSTVLSALKSGSRVLCFVDTSTKAPASAPFRIVRRDAGWYDGNWASNFNWFAPGNNVFENYPHPPRFDFESAAIFPGVVLADIAPEHFSDVLAGMFVGWMHLNSAYVARMKVGAGTLVLCTLNVPDRFSSDPVAAWLFAGLLKVAAESERQPAWEWSPAGNGK